MALRSLRHAPASSPLRSAVLVCVNNTFLFEVLVPTVLTVVAVSAAIRLVRISLAAWRATSPSVLEIVLAPSLAAEHAEIDLTSMLLSGDMSAVHYGSLMAALAHEQSSIRPPESSVETGRSPAS